MCLTMPSNSSTTPSNPESTGSSSSSAAAAASSSHRPPASSSIPPEEAETVGDEVKVFADEDEREENGNDQFHQVGILSDIKSKLITETEQKTSDSRHAFPVPEKFFDPAFHAYMAPYLMNNYAAAYAANSSLVRSPFLYGDPLASPPPAHVGAPHVGLRPPLYSLPHAQYHYSMLGGVGPEQLAAWHQASMYQQNALRAASPYSLQITSGLTSPMSRFSPGGLLGSHPGLSPGLGGHPGAHPHHLPHVKHEHGHHYDRKHSDKDSSPGKSKKDHIKKPLNAFMLYMKEMRPVVQAECTLKESAAINQILGRRWHSLSRDEQAKYYEKARQERQKHLQMYPHWNARDNYRYGLKKKKRKRDKSDDPAATMKKCRARYGLDQQDLWCRPCKRKKKCVRVQSYIDGKLGEGGLTNGGQSGPGGSGDGSEKSRHAINNNLSDSKSRNGIIHSDDDNDESDDEDDDDDNSPTSHQGRNSVESNSEQSLTSPAGFSSLPSLGSPSGSVASPSTPGTYENTPNSVGAAQGSLLSGGQDPPYWYPRPHGGAFKPPSSSSSGGMYQPSSLQHAHSIQALHHYHQQLAALQQRAPVGTDPRDAKNPLSISQLTGNHCSTSSHHGGSVAVPPGPAADSKRTLLGMT